MSHRSMAFATAALAVLLLLVGCSSKPSNTDVEEAVRACLENNIFPFTGVGILVGGTNAKVATVEIIKWGLYNKRREYWPVKVRVVGSAELSNPFNQGKVKFDEVAEFHLCKDDYGNWQASLSHMFQ